MPKGFYCIPEPSNEPIYNYDLSCPKRAELEKTLELMNNSNYDVPMRIGKEEVRTNKKIHISPPHDHHHVIGCYYEGSKEHIEQAIEAALNSKEMWQNLGWEHRAAIFLKAAELVSTKYRARLNAATMLGQGKNIYQAEIDAACELSDFLRFNVHYMSEIYSEQPQSSTSVWNRLDYRPLEGFVFALTPFNFTAIAGNLPAAPAMMGNVVVWKPSPNAVYSAGILLELFEEAGLPKGVINMITVDGNDASDVIFSNPHFAGLHFTGSTKVFQEIWKTIGSQIHKYRSYPRIVGETGGKDFVLVHPSADVKSVSTALSRGAFEYQGQKCSAASRAYVPASLWNDILEDMKKDAISMNIGSPLDFTNFINAVIDEKSYTKLVETIEYVRKSSEAEIVIGGKYDNEVGYFIYPTVVVATNPHFRTMEEELFGPILTVYVYDDNDYELMPDLIDSTSLYALTGALFAQDRYVIEWTCDKLSNAAGNFYINDKPTGAVVGQQPFGGSRGSGTNDKAGSKYNLLRWVSPRTIKETFIAPIDYRYPFLG